MLQVAIWENQSVRQKLDDLTKSKDLAKLETWLSELLGEFNPDDLHLQLAALTVLASICKPADFFFPRGVRDWLNSLGITWHESDAVTRCSNIAAQLVVKLDEAASTRQDGLAKRALLNIVMRMHWSMSRGQKLFPELPVYSMHEYDWNVADTYTLQPLLGCQIVKATFSSFRIGAIEEASSELVLEVVALGVSGSVRFGVSSWLRTIAFSRIEDSYEDYPILKYHNREDLAAPAELPESCLVVFELDESEEFSHISGNSLVDVQILEEQGLVDCTGDSGFRLRFADGTDVWFTIVGDCGEISAGKVSDLHGSEVSLDGPWASEVIAKLLVDNK